MKKFKFANPLDALTKSDLEKLKKLEECDNLDFTKAVQILGLNPSRDFRFSDLSGINLDGVDHEVFDFTGAVFGPLRIEEVDVTKAIEGVVVEVFLESQILEYACKILVSKGFKGFTILPVVGGGGRSGDWVTLDGLSSYGIVVLSCIIPAQRRRELIELLSFGFGEHIGEISTREVQYIKGRNNENQTK